ncbi:hypothetical protein GIB67_040942 [Kingdonia uniflora]|uniref:Retrotransposon gag domain-containing protein n=1 Tax=Kingdonia uniflora TaxID=39325 RepID=A0A7J7LYA5_9MAGN|nr:hypothetical protein GIB67_040942 [Kingdonia uniflora]
MIPGVIQFVLCLFLAKLEAHTFLYWLPFYLSQIAIGGEYISVKSTGNLSTLFDLGGIVGGILTGYITDKLSVRPTAAATFMYAAIPAMPLYRVYVRVSKSLNILLIMVAGLFVNGPYALITITVSVDLGTQHSLMGNSRALTTVSAIIDGMGSASAALRPLISGFHSSKSTGVDMSFSKDDSSIACAALIVLDSTSFKVVYQDFRIVGLHIPYIPGFGLACNLGVLANLPTIGIGKNVRFCSKRLKLKNQIIMFSQMLEHQYHLMKYPVQPEVLLALMQNEIHPMSGLYSKADHLMCHLFLTSLTDSPLRWYHNLTSGSIRSFEQLSRLFITQFAFNKDREVRVDALFNFRKSPNEILEAFTKRFLDELRKVENLDCVNAVLAYSNILPDSSRVKEYLVLHKPRTLMEILSKFNGYIDHECLQKLNKQGQPLTTNPNKPRQGPPFTPAPLIAHV